MEHSIITSPWGAKSTNSNLRDVDKQGVTQTSTTPAARSSAFATEAGISSPYGVLQGGSITKLIHGPFWVGMDVQRGPSSQVPHN
jgi:hypothetical protein